jgi:elongation factor Ts
MAKAEELLRVKLGTKAGKAAGRITAEGVVATARELAMRCALIEVNCETDFVTKNDSFLALANAAASLVAKHDPADVPRWVRCRTSRTVLAPRWKTCARA